jgi:heptosyltransferase-2
MIDQIRRILLIRTDRIGDVILTAPVATILHQYNPNIHISFLTRKYTAELIKHHSYIDEVISYDANIFHSGLTGTLKLSKELKQKKFDAAILFYPRFELALSILLARIPVRIGSGYRWYSMLLNKRIYEHRKHGLKHELDYNISLLRAIGIVHDGPVTFEFKLSRKLQDNWHEITGNLKLISDYVVIHPGNGGSAPNLSLNQYQFIIDTIMKKTDMAVILTGTEDEYNFNQSVISPNHSNRIMNIAGKFSLIELMVLIQRAHLFISSSTGPLHIANAFDIPLLSFYCPSIPCSPQRWGPYHQQEWVLTPNIKPCKTCDLKKCFHGNCLEKITNSEIESRIISRLNSLF